MVQLLRILHALAEDPVKFLVPNLNFTTLHDSNFYGAKSLSENHRLKVVNVHTCKKALRYMHIIYLNIYKYNKNCELHLEYLILISKKRTCVYQF